MQNQINYVQNLINTGGPKPEEYEKLNNFFVEIYDRLTTGEMNHEEVRKLWELFDPIFTPATMQGLVCRKQHGYAGDFEIIDKIYQEWISPDPHFANWDRFSHWQSATEAVRNRKRFFIEKFSAIAQNNNRNYQILNVGSGPGRDVAEFFSKNPTAKMKFHCVDMDKKAIAYAQKICQELTPEQILFYHSNIFRFKSDINYDFIWSAGLFDYLDDKKFIFLLKRLLSMLKPDGTIIIGNFSPANTSRQYMEFGEWFLHHRNQTELQSLAQQCGPDTNHITIEQEPEGVNLFLVINR